MGKTDFKSVDQYLATQPESARAVLEQVRGIPARLIAGIAKLRAKETVERALARTKAKAARPRARG